MRARLFASVALAAASSLAGCGPVDPEEDAELETRSGSLYQRGAPWPVGSGGITTVPVCFRTSGDYPPAEESRLRGLVQESIEASWGAWTKLAFTGFGECADPPANATLAIKLTMFNPQGEPTGGGDIPDQTMHDSGMRGFQGADTPLYDWMSLGGGTNRSVWLVVAHEVGHALSFEHEQSRPDSVARCPAGDSVLAPGTVLTSEYDDMSVMNYCAPIDFGRLSWLDIRGAQLMYGINDAGWWLDSHAGIFHMMTS